MSTIEDPVTRVQLNPILIERITLDWDEAVTAWRLRLKGVKYQIVAQMLGTNTHRLGEVFRGEVHEGSEAAARALLLH